MFELALPWIFLCLPLPALIWWLCPRVATRLPQALKIPFFNVLANIMDKVEKNNLALGRMRISLLFLIWSLLLCALAGPRWVGEINPVAQEGHNIMLALDISGSMQLTDMVMQGRAATRLAVVKRAAKNFVQARAGDKIGLILFGTHAYLQTPLTYDHQNVLMRLDDASVGLAGNTTSIGDAIGLAIKRLQNAPVKGRVIILLTDGVNNSGVLPPDKAAEIARAQDIKIYTIGLRAAVDPTLNRLFFDMTAAAYLDEDSLKEIAKITGGRYFLATNLASLEKIYQDINKLETTNLALNTVRPQHDYYPWPLALALLLFLYWLKIRALSPTPLPLAGEGNSFYKA